MKTKSIPHECYPMRDKIVTSRKPHVLSKGKSKSTNRVTKVARVKSQPKKVVKWADLVGIVKYKGPPKTIRELQLESLPKSKKK